MSHGATCLNWTWSWSFVNKKKKIVIFGAWDTNKTKNGTVILRRDWEISRKGRVQPGYSQAIEHIRLVEQHGYSLMTFPMIYSEIEEDAGCGPARIAGFEKKITRKYLLRENECWYAVGSDPSFLLPEELDHEGILNEGLKSTIVVNAYERNHFARSKCLAHYGYSCAVCSFNFEIMYGELGKNYIHVHHIVPISEIKKEYVVDPIKDLIPLCPNCHAMIHSVQPCLTVNQLRNLLNLRRKGISRGTKK
ncbi:HNH endonuclease [Xanthomonas campestris pv. campestris]|uniref:HNH endonuclease n=1 Tax=Xanthomonas campestris TaxID=339 RepID=UPI0025A2FA9A|nr:HNH endonuclease [Xanthomonas campestris]MEA0907782.1 HNH endonuclease [Xanthomonas campestris pv. campestris]MEB1944872.1 HNH endonuclease [Xanthomonas campestris pv. campestris]